jgi:hypothetical protein
MVSVVVPPSRTARPSRKSASLNSTSPEVETSWLFSIWMVSLPSETVTSPWLRGSLSRPPRVKSTRFVSRSMPPFQLPSKMVS